MPEARDSVLDLVHLDPELISRTHMAVPEIAIVTTTATHAKPSQRRRAGVVSGASGKTAGRFGSDRLDKDGEYGRGRAEPKDGADSKRCRGALDRQLAINVGGVVAAVRQAAKIMGSGGRIISIGSNGADHIPFAGSAEYAVDVTSTSQRGKHRMSDVQLSASFTITESTSPNIGLLRRREPARRAATRLVRQISRRLAHIVGVAQM